MPGNHVCLFTGDDGEMNTSLTKMLWLNDFGLKGEGVGSERLLFPSIPSNRRLESRHNKSVCCGRGVSVRLHHG